MFMWKRYRMLFIIAMLGMMFVVVACGGSDQQAQPEVDESFEGKTIHIRMNEYAFEPAVIELEQGEPVQLVVTNEGRIVHDMVIVDGQNEVRTPMLGAGESHTLVFTPSSSGRLETYCSVPGHKALGMIGEVQVK